MRVPNFDIVKIVVVVYQASRVGGPCPEEYEQSEPTSPVQWTPGGLQERRSGLIEVDGLDLCQCKVPWLKHEPADGSTKN